MWAKLAADVVPLIAAGADRRDRVIVVAAGDQRAADGERDEVGAER